MSEAARTPEPLILLVAALGAGLAAAFGRELQAGRKPNRSWWFARLLLLPLLAISAATASEALGLSPSMRAFAAAMLSLGGYDGLRLVEGHWRQRVGAALSKSVPSAAGQGGEEAQDIKGQGRG